MALCVSTASAKVHSAPSCSADTALDGTAAITPDRLLPTGRSRSEAAPSLPLSGGRGRPLCRQLRWLYADNGGITTLWWCEFSTKGARGGISMWHLALALPRGSIAYAP